MTPLSCKMLSRPKAKRVAYPGPGNATLEDEEDDRLATPKANRLMTTPVFIIPGE